MKPGATSWNSIYFCIQSALRLQEAITIFLRDHGYTIAPSTGNDSDAEDCTTVDMHITEGDWVDLKEVMEVLGPLKEFIEKCESNSTCGISSVLRLSLVLLYHVMPAHVRHLGSQTSKQKKFVITLQDEFTSLLDDTEKFFLWACAAALDGR